MQKITCNNCCYFWYNEEYGREMCNYPPDDPFPSPCEEDVIYEDENEDYEY